VGSLLHSGEGVDNWGLGDAPGVQVSDLHSSLGLGEGFKGGGDIKSKS
jgi:hypothetical protein